MKQASAVRTVFCGALSQRVAKGRGTQCVNTHSPTTTYTVGYRNVSDMCNFPIVWSLDWLVPSQLRISSLSQAAAAELLCSIPSLLTMCRYSCYMWLHHAQARVTKCLQGTAAACSPRPRHLCELPTSASDVSSVPFFFFLHVVAFAVQTTTIFPYSLIFPEALSLSSSVCEIQRVDFGMFSHALETSERGAEWLGGGFVARSTNRSRN